MATPLAPSQKKVQITMIVGIIVLTILEVLSGLMTYNNWAWFPGFKDYAPGSTPDMLVWFWRAVVGALLVGFGSAIVGAYVAGSIYRRDGNFDAAEGINVRFIGRLVFFIITCGLIVAFMAGPDIYNPSLGITAAITLLVGLIVLVIERLIDDGAATGAVHGTQTANRATTAPGAATVTTNRVSDGVVYGIIGALAIFILIFALAGGFKRNSSSVTTVTPAVQPAPTNPAVPPQPINNYYYNFTPDPNGLTFLERENGVKKEVVDDDEWGPPKK